MYSFFEAVRMLKRWLNYGFTQRNMKHERGIEYFEKKYIIPRCEKSKNDITNCDKLYVFKKVS